MPHPHNHFTVSDSESSDAALVRHASNPWDVDEYHEYSTRGERPSAKGVEMPLQQGLGDLKRGPGCLSGTMG